MKFEDLPAGQDYKHQIGFAEGDEAEAVGAAFRERVANLLIAGKRAGVSDYDLDFSTWDSESEHSMLVNHPNVVAKILETFHEQTDEAITKIARNLEASFDSDAIARRIVLGQKANQLAGLIRGHDGVSELVQELEDLDSAWFTNGNSSAES